MPARYRAARLAVSRAGASTLAELACCGVPAVLVPYPHAAQDHQRYNAEIFIGAGAARLVEQRSDSGAMGRTLVDVISSLVNDYDELAKMRLAMIGQAHVSASQRVVDETARLLGLEPFAQ
jgi:UDP-N-acetylglucosamine--N-acetylmuramyl-(pentapeptide) pyrophosphoryl-undecaprenol N-acetylglucosamine transferase